MLIVFFLNYKQAFVALPPEMEKMSHKMTVWRTCVPADVLTAGGSQRCVQ